MLRQLDLCSGVGSGFPLAGLRLREFKLIGVAENHGTSEQGAIALAIEVIIKENAAAAA